MRGRINAQGRSVGAHVADGACAIEQRCRVAVGGRKAIDQHERRDAARVEPLGLGGAFLVDHHVGVATARQDNHRGVRAGAGGGIAVEPRNVAVAVAGLERRAPRPKPQHRGVAVGRRGLGYRNLRGTCGNEEGEKKSSHTGNDTPVPRLLAPARGRGCSESRARFGLHFDDEDNTHRLAGFRQRTCGLVYRNRADRPAFYRARPGHGGGCAGDV